ncbi:hypothetical protein LCGC14_0777840 [marine sediment metagenome]|uniref:Uncharacterized protein n=1 Tax=marine sediment metagenome TaxID=412755 RepID=A0A0F9QG88_9ZZZZ
MRFESSFVFAAAKKYLPKGSIQKLFTKSTRLFNMWATDPRTSAIVARNPIDRIRILLNELDDFGQGHVSRAAIDYMAEPLGCHCVEKSGAKSDKGTIDGEVADISIALGNLGSEVREALKNGEIDSDKRRLIVEAARNVKRQVEELLDAAGMNK